MKKLSTTTITLLVIGLLIVGGFFWGVGKRNSFVQSEESVTTAWANVQTQYQRRADLIPNLVSTVKGYAQHEQNTLQGVVKARAAATSIQINPEELTPEKLQAFQATQSQLSQALGRLLALSEHYPELKANEQFSELQAQLEGTENRINESRLLYNKEVQNYNIMVRTFPDNIISSIFGFQRKTKFQADAAAEKAPQVTFD